jgi:hypothetical protein
MIMESKRWHAYLSVVWVVALAIWFLATTRFLLDKGLVTASLDLAVWTALVVVQAMIWGYVVYANLGIVNSLSRARVGWANATVFVVVSLLALALPLGAAAVVGTEILGSPNSGYVGGVIQLAGFISVIPAILVIYNSRAISIDGDWGVDAESVRALRHLQSSVRAATLSLGVVIAVAIIVTSFVRDALAQNIETFNVEPEHILLYGGFFTAFVFALYSYGKSAIDGRARQMVDDAIPTVGLNPHDTFFDIERSRKDMETALGLGTSARQGFENLVIVASPLLSAVLATFVTP